MSEQLASLGWAAVPRGDGPRRDGPLDGTSGPVAEVNRRVDHPAAVSRTRSWRPAAVLVTILLTALAVRGYWALHGDPVLDGNGCEYARIVRNLLTHRAYVGLFEGPELMFPPVFPFLLAVGARVAGSLDLSLRVVPVLAGLLLVPAVFALARLVYGVRVALGAAALVALHPLLVDVSRAVLSEGVFLLLMVAGLYWGLRSMESGAAGHSLVCGTLFGIAYLTRPEAVLYAAVVLVAGSLRDLQHRSAVRHLARRAFCLLAPMLVLAAPYSAFLWWHTGSLRLEGKSVLNYTIAVRRNAGMSAYQAAFGIGTDLAEDGPHLSPNRFVATARLGGPVRGLVESWLASARRNREPITQLLLKSPILGFPLGLGLMVLGLLGHPWSPRRARSEAVLLAVVIGQVALLLGLHVVNARYLFPIVPISLLWIAQGIDVGARWGRGTARRGGLGLQGRAWVDTAVRVTLIVAVLVLVLWTMRWGSLERADPGALVLRSVGAWLQDYHPGPKRVMSVEPQIPYYAAGTFLPLPYADGSMALRYIRTKHPDFVVLTEESSGVTPYIADWLASGIPDPAARLVYRTGRERGPLVLVYEWHDP